MAGSGGTASDRAERLERHRATVASGILAHARRLRWGKERLDAERERALRQLLAFAKEHSPYHARRLADVDPAEFTEAQLPHLPVMTKHEMMAEFSGVTTDRRLTADIVERHLAAVDEGGDEYLLDRYRAIATSGSSGLRGIYVYDWDGWTTLGLMASRSRLAMLDGSPRPPGSATVNLLGSGAATLSSAMSSFLADPNDPAAHLPMTAPIPAIVAVLEAAQPTVLQAYPSGLDLLVREATADRLHIAPRFVESGGEMLSERTREDVRALWGVEIDDCWGLSEGIYAFTCPAGGTIHLPDDLVIVEPIDLDGNVVPPGEPAAKVYVTNLYNLAQPLVRFEIPDGLTVHEGICACGSAHRRISALAGRHDQVFHYGGGVSVYPMALGFAIEEEPGVIEYQFHQTRRGVALHVVIEPSVLAEDLRRRVLGVLDQAGLVDPEATIEVVDHIERLPSGKLRQFVAAST